MCYDWSNSKFTSSAARNKKKNAVWHKLLSLTGQWTEKEYKRLLTFLKITLKEVKKNFLQITAVKTYKKNVNFPLLMNYVYFNIKC